MAKAKLKSRPGSKPGTDPRKSAGPSPRDAGKATGQTIMESAQQIWLAGLGALAKAQEGGGKLFESLIREGSSLEQKTRKIATGTVGDVRGAVESGVSQVRERTQETWDKLEQVFETRVSRALAKLGVPGRKELDDLIRRVDELNRQVARLDLGKPARTLAQSATSGMRRVRDDLSDLVKDVEEVQLAARNGTKPEAARPKRAVPPAPKPARRR